MKESEDEFERNRKMQDKELKFRRIANRDIDYDEVDYGIDKYRANCDWQTNKKIYDQNFDNIRNGKP